jgi:hypothetical protein
MPFVLATLPLLAWRRRTIRFVDWFFNMALAQAWVAYRHRADEAHHGRPDFMQKIDLFSILGQHRIRKHLLFDNTLISIAALIMCITFRPALLLSPHD